MTLSGKSKLIVILETLGKSKLIVDNFEQVKTMLFPLILILHEIIYISCEIDSYFKTSSIKTNKNYITPFLSQKLAEKVSW